MRYVIFGAGGIGGTIAAALRLASASVCVIARGPHLAAMQTSGLQFVTPSQTRQLALHALADPAQAAISDDDVVILATKSQHTAAALTALRAATDAEPAIVCAQNGVDNERQALRLFARVYGMEVVMPTTHLHPGEVEVHTENVYGLLDLGRYPSEAPSARVPACDSLATRIAADLSDAGFSSVARPDIMAWKYRKLVRNLGNGVALLIGDSAATRDIVRILRGEATAVFAAAGIHAIGDAQYRVRTDQLDRSLNNNQRRQGSSTLQSVLRQADSVETDYLNGEIVLLGRLCGVQTPVNAHIQALAAHCVGTAHGGRQIAPGSLDGVQLLHTARDLLQAAANAHLHAHAEVATDVPAQTLNASEPAQ